MADAERPFDITWDDLRQARRRRAPTAMTAVILMSVTVIGVLVYRAGASTPPPPAAEVSEAPPIERRSATRVRKSAPTLCGELSRWSASTVLQLSRRTQSYCSARFPS